MWRVWGERWKVHTGFWCGNLREGDHLEDLWEDNIKVDLKNIGYGQVAGSC